VADHPALRYYFERAAGDVQRLTRRDGRVEVIIVWRIPVAGHGRRFSHHRAAISQTAAFGVELRTLPE
jgi:hypothetical protein